MTAQIGDYYHYKETRYTVISMSSDFPFNPTDYGLESHMSSTACYRGYWCDFSVADDVLVLKTLYLYNRNDCYPPLNGVEVSPMEYEECWSFDASGNEKTVKHPAHMGHRVYENVNLPIPYTGTIKVGADFDHQYYIHMGFQRWWAFNTVLELVFENGKLKQRIDLSDEAKKERESLQAAGKIGIDRFMSLVDDEDSLLSDFLMTDDETDE